MRIEKEKLLAFWKQNRIFLLMLCAGVLLLTGGRSERKAERDSVFTSEEERLRITLSQMEGVGEVTVLLSKGPGRSDGYAGAVVVSAGADTAAVRLRIVEAVQAFTGLGANRIVVEAMNHQ